MRCSSRQAPSELCGRPEDATGKLYALHGCGFVYNRLVNGKFLAASILFATLLVACNKQPSSNTTAAAPSATNASSAPAANDAVQQKMQELAGSGATDCGRPKAMDSPEIPQASDCAMKAAKDKKPFYVAYDMPGLSVGVAGNAEGKLYTVSYNAGQSGQPGKLDSAPCPAELRIAQSGRVTCLPAGSMGMTSSGANPHATGEQQSPHGGMMAPPKNMPNPHK